MGHGHFKVHNKGQDRRSVGSMKPESGTGRAEAGRTNISSVVRALANQHINVAGLGDHPQKINKFGGEVCTLNIKIVALRTGNAKFWRMPVIAKTLPGPNASISLSH